MTIQLSIRTVDVPPQHVGGIDDLLFPRTSLCQPQFQQVVR
jgi:hypothetical protein